MKKLEFNSTTYDVAETIWDLSLGDFLDIVEIYNNPDEIDNLTTQMRLVHHVSGIPIAVLEDMPFDTFDDLAGYCTLKEFVLPETVTADEINLKASKEPLYFELDGETYFFQPDYAFTKTSITAKVEDILRGKDLHRFLHYVLALCAWRKDELFDPATMDAKAIRMCKVPMSAIYKPLFIGALSGMNFSRVIGLFGKAEKARAARSNPSSPNGVGSASSMTSQNMAR